ncbi:MAG: MamI family restriction endonuclease [Gammaproteobacteria bacterium]|nr:MamI family restriction endonuclease [Gammaproteobacteria bacterium]
MKTDPAQIVIQDNVRNIKKMLLELMLYPRRDLMKWARITKQTPNTKIGYIGQHLASLVTGVEGTRTGARGHDLSDGSEVKSCSRVDQLDKCNECGAAVARIEAECPKCGSTDVKRNNDSKWLISIKSRPELDILLNHVPRVVLILSDYLNYEEQDWDTLQFQVFEIWPTEERHINFKKLMENYLYRIYEPHIEQDPSKTPAPKNLWPYSFQFFMCNPIRTFHCIAKNVLEDPQLEVLEYVEPLTDRTTIEPILMPLSALNDGEKEHLHQCMGDHAYALAEKNGLSAQQRLSLLTLRDTDYASPQQSSYQRGVR